MSKVLLNKIILYTVIALLTIGAGFGTWAIIDHFNEDTDTDKLVVYTSIYSMTDFTKRVGGNKVEVRTIYTPGQNAHGVIVDAKKLADMEESDLVVLNGLGMESYEEDLLETLGEDKVLLTGEDENITLIASSHEEEHEEEEHEEEEEEDHHHHGEYDVHVWHSLSNAIVQMNLIKEALIEIDADNADYYETNYKANEMLFTSLKNSYDTLLQGLSNDTFYVTHGAFGYLAHEYGLTQESIDLSDYVDTSGQAVQQKIDEMIDNNVNVIFYTSGDQQAIANTISNETGAKVAELSAMGILTQEELDAGYDYAILMARNLNALVEALS